MQFSRDNLWLNASHIVMDGLYDSVPILLSFVVVFYGAGEKDAGFIVSLGACVSTAGGLATKFFGARCGLWSSLALILGCAGAGFLGNAFAPSLLLSGLCFVVSICGMGLYHSLTFAHLSVHSSKRWLGKTIGDFTAIGDIGRIPIASLAGFGAALSLGGQPGWRAVSLVYGACTLFFALCLWRRGRLQQPDDVDEPLGEVASVAGAREPEQAAETPQPQTLAAQPQAAKTPAGEMSQTGTSSAETPSAAPAASAAPVKESLLPSFGLLRRRPVALTMLANVLDGFSSAHIFTFLPFLLFAKGIDPKIIGGFALTFAVGSLIGKMVCGRLAAYCGAKAIFVGAELLMVVLLVVMVMVHDMWWILAASILLGIVTRGTVPVLQTLLVDPMREPEGGAAGTGADTTGGADDRRFASRCEDIFSLSSLFRGGTNMLTPLLFGLISAASSIENVYLLMAAVAVLAVVPVLMLRGEKCGPA